MAKIKYWVISPNVKNNEEQQQWKDYITKNGYVFMGWGDDNKYGNMFVNLMQIGDRVLVAQGVNNNKHIYIVGIVKTKAIWQHKKGTPSEAYNRKLEPWITKDELDSAKIIFSEKMAYGAAAQIPAIYQLYPDRNVDDKKIVDKLESILKENDVTQKENDQYEKHIKTLEVNRNIIFTGAPGTGKTYLAKEIAKKFVGENFFNTNVVFVQFHSSYDYTDFVEGLRPVDKGNMQIGFELRMGMFKEFCKKAQENSKQKFVFIIDEINRGEISKIFGELFFALDPGYRGINGRVKTQYSNLIPEGDVFKAGFYVPENVYIIGTMNDIDRSVESFDFAMRRRFTWIEITAEKSAENMNLSDEVKKRMFSLNNAISQTEGLNPSYHIGGAYFLKLQSDDYEQLWDYHLAPLLREYLRGISDSTDKFEVLEHAYNLISDANKDVEDNEDA
jgi:5-methylcytosine-specific restriction endonuclease McrBC GTP-binding regulatory subunit McrB